MKTIALTNPKCSHCGYELDDEETWHSRHSKIGVVHVDDCEESELKCPNSDCGQTFYVRCVHHVTFKCVDKDGDEL